MGKLGYLFDGYKYKFSPLYDNGAGLFPDVNKVINNYINESTRVTFMKERVFTFPASLFKIKKEDRAYRTNYYEMFSDLRINKQFASQVKEVRNNVSYSDVFNTVSKIVIPIESLNPWYKRFYIEIITLRYMCIVLRMDFNKSYRLLEGELR